MPHLDAPLGHIVLDELHLLLRITDILLFGIIGEAMELDDKDDYFKNKGEPKGVHLAMFIRHINTCGVTFTIWEKRNEDGKSTGKKDLILCADVINPDPSPTTMI